MADCVRNKIDSNTTGLAVAEEVCSRQLPTIAEDGYDAEWFELEPNSYDDFGGEIKKVARKPINKNRRNQKGGVVDKDATAGINQDFTQHNTNKLLEGFFFSEFREQPTTYPLRRDARIEITGAVASNDRYTAASGLFDLFDVNDLMFVSGADTPANNGLKLVDEVAATYVGITGALTDETPTGTIILTRVGHRFSAAAVSMAMAGSLGVLTLAATPVAAEGELTLVAAPSNDDTVTIGDVTYTFKTVPADPYDILIGTTIVSAENLRAAINGDLLDTPEHPLFSATDDGAGVITITARIAGTVGNGYETTETLTNVGNVWTAAATSGGTGYSWYSLVQRVGAWVYVGGDEALTAFTNNVGYARVGSMTDTTLTFDKTTWVPEAEAAGAFTIEVYAGNLLLDEDYELQVTKFFQFERTLGEDADGTQAEYIRGCVANELTLNVPLADKISADLAFIGADTSRRTGAQGLKDGTRFELLGEEFFNTSSHVVRNNLAVIDPETSVPTQLFTYITEGTLTINNNVSPFKVIGALGGIDVNTGNFDVGGEVSAVFTTVEAINAVEDNSDVTLDFIAAFDNHGVIWDIPLLTLAGGMPEIEENVHVKLPLEMMGAENPNDYTMSFTSFDYLPLTAMPQPDDLDE
jgi:hypothetical protein